MELAMIQAAKTTGLAVREAMIEGLHITGLEASILFGSQNLYAEVQRLRAAGFIVHSQRVTMISVVRRINKFATLTPPGDLPTKEILMTEYWVGR